MTQARIEAAVASDQDAVVALFAADLPTQRIEHDHGNLAALFAALIDDERRVVLVVRERDGEVAAGVLVAHRILSVKFGGPALWIEELYVGKEYRRRGYGRELVEALLDMGHDQGMRGIDLEAYHGNDGAALLYRSVGFRRLGRERFHYRYDWEEE